MQLSPQQYQQLKSLYRRALQAGIPPERVSALVDKYARRQDSSLQVEEQLDQQQLSDLQRQVPGWKRYSAWAVPISLITFGLGMVLSAIGPILLYYFFTSPQLVQAQLAEPIPAHRVILPDVRRAVNAAGQAQVTTVDYTNLANWFGEQPQLVQSADQEPDAYYLDIPTLNIENAEIRLGGTNLDKSLIQYPGTAEPGELGAPVIFGHSVLRQFYNPAITNPKRYVSIFSYLMTLEPGEDIFVTYQGKRYHYQVIDKKEVKPEDVFILQQRFDARLLKLVTCVPEGTYLRRGVVTARLLE